MCINKYLNPDYNKEVLTWINSNLKNYLNKVVDEVTQNVENQGEIEHILDYLNSNAAPSRLRKMSYNEAKKGAEKWVAALTKKGNDITETESDTVLFKDFNDGFKIVKLKSEDSYKREGNLMSHCVASYYGKSDCEVYSLRDAVNSPHCTIEIVRDGEYIQQIKGKGNGSIHPKYINYIMTFLKEIGQEVRGSELTNLGYDDVSHISGMWEFLEQNFDGIQFLSFGGTKYLYKYSKLIRKA